jgi:hypothetical protein
MCDSAADDVSHSKACSVAHCGLSHWQMPRRRSPSAALAQHPRGVPGGRGSPTSRGAFSIHLPASIVNADHASCPLYGSQSPGRGERAGAVQIAQSQSASARACYGRPRALRGPSRSLTTHDEDPVVAPGGWGRWSATVSGSRDAVPTTTFMPGTLRQLGDDHPDPRTDHHEGQSARGRSSAQSVIWSWRADTGAVRAARFAYGQRRRCGSR